jgi:hypothetical protein
MARKLEQVWQPSLDRFLEENEKLVARQPTTSTGLLIKTAFNIKTIKRIYDLLQDRCVAVQRECKVDQNQLRGETGGQLGLLSAIYPHWDGRYAYQHACRLGAVITFWEVWELRGIHLIGW